MVLVLYDPDRTEPSDFFAVLDRVAAQRAGLGVLPIRSGETTAEGVARFLRREPIPLSLAECRFRLGSSPLYSDPRAPAVLRRALEDTIDAAASDAGARFLFLQGHSGPVDGSFGRAMTLCSREVHLPGEAIFFPCAGTKTCFRQSPMGEPPNLVNPRSLAADIVVLDGCGTFPVPGSIYAFDQSLLRGFMLGDAMAAVLSIGVSATSPGLPVLFMAALAQGMPLGEVVRLCNVLRARANSPTSSMQAGASPWILIGDPALRVTGLELTEVSPIQWSESGYHVALPPGDDGDTGRMIALRGFDRYEPLEIAETSTAWAVGGNDGAGSIYLWTGSHDDSPAPPQIVLRAATARPQPWRDSVHWLRASCDWLSGLADTVATRRQDAGPIKHLIGLRQRAADALELALHAATPANVVDVARGFGSVESDLRKLLVACDEHGCEVVAAMIPHAGARLSHLCAPAWHSQGTVAVGRNCVCGTPISGHMRTHPLWGIGRIELSCPVCSLIGDVAASPEAPNVPDGFATLECRVLARGEALVWQVETGVDGLSDGFACAILFDPYRERIQRSALIELVKGCQKVTAAIPLDWPEGMSWATLVTAVAGRISMFAFDIVIRGRGV